MYHITKNGEYGKCKAEPGNCPFDKKEGTIHVEKKSEAIAKSCEKLRAQYADFNNVQLKRRK